MRPKVLVLLSHYLPGYRMGGPLRSVLGLVDQLGDEFAFRILTSDRDLGDKEPYPGVARGAWRDFGAATVYHAPPEQLSLPGMARIIGSTPHDLLYLNSFFSPRFTLQPLLARRTRQIPRRPLLLAPRGEFSSGALAIKGVRKQLYLSVGRACGMFDDVCWHASGPQEAEDIGRALGPCASPIHVASDLLTRPAELPPPPTPRLGNAPLRVVFLSRITPMKNLDFALRVLGMVREPVAFSIYGPPEDQLYAMQCRKVADALPPHVSVRWHGSVPPAEVAGTLAKYDLFFLPTRGENFGHVIAESLAAGTPVLLADTTPWRGLESAGIGYDFPLAAPERFVAAIEAMASESSEISLTRRERAFRFAAERQRDGADILANRLLFRTALGAATPTNSSEDT